MSRRHKKTLARIILAAVLLVAAHFVPDHDWIRLMAFIIPYAVIGFDVLWLDCYAEHGSSGGAVMDTDFDIVGITYAVASDKFGNFKYSLAIPSEKIIEFLNKYGVQ